MRTLLPICAALGWFAAAAGAHAGDTLPPNPTPDKGRYSLFNPVPDDQQREFSPDRPSQFTGPVTVDPGHFQLEMDLVNYVYDRHNPERDREDVDQWNVAPFDLRVGLTKNTEIDFLYDGYLNVRTRTLKARKILVPNVVFGAPVYATYYVRDVSVKSGFGDLTLLFKYNLFGNEGGTFAFGILPYLKLPTNTTHLGNKYVEGGVELPLNINLPANFQLGIQAEFDAVRNDADTRYEAAFTDIAYLGYSFLDKKFTVYAEWYSRVNQGPDSQVDGEVDAGLIYFVGKNAEVDFGCNFGVTRAAPDYQPFVGLSVRY